MSRAPRTAPTVAVVHRPSRFAAYVIDGLQNRGFTVHPHDPTERSASRDAPPRSVTADTWILIPSLEQGTLLRPELHPAPTWPAAGPEGVPHRILVSSAAVYGADPHHPGMVGESGWRHPAAASGVAAQWVEYERLLAGGPGDTAGVAVLRVPSVPLPGAPGIHPLLGSHRTRIPFGRDPMIQVLAPSDLVDALAQIVRARGEGVFNLTPRAPATLRDAVRASGGRPSLSAGEHPRPGPEESAYLRHCWTVRGDRIRDRFGFVADRSTLEALGAAASKDSAPEAHDPGPARRAPDPDPFGMDPGLIDRLGRSVFRFLHDRWWRIHVEGLEHVPPRGPVVLVGVHRGFVPLDAMMLLHLMTRRIGRSPRFLIHPGLMRAPLVSVLIPRLGGVVACQENADHVLARGGVLGVYPEGVRGAFREVRDAYRLGRFRYDFVTMAHRHGAPILPVVTVGNAEAFPVWRNLDWGWWKQVSEWPSFPVSHGLVLPAPLPTRWQTRFLSPVELPTHLPLDDSREVRRIGSEIRSRMQRETNALLARRRGWFTLRPGRIGRDIRDDEGSAPSVP